MVEALELTSQVESLKEETKVASKEVDLKVALPVVETVNPLLSLLVTLALNHHNNHSRVTSLKSVPLRLLELLWETTAEQRVLLMLNSIPQIALKRPLNLTDKNVTVEPLD